MQVGGFALPMSRDDGHPGDPDDSSVPLCLRGRCPVLILDSAFADC
jgi:hypothetical protein